MKTDLFNNMFHPEIVKDAFRILAYEDILDEEPLYLRRRMCRDCFSMQGYEENDWLCDSCYKAQVEEARTWPERKTAKQAENLRKAYDNRLRAAQARAEGKLWLVHGYESTAAQCELAAVSFTKC